METKKKGMLAEYKQAGPPFFIPVQVNDAGEIFTADVQPVNQEEDEDNEDIKAAAWFESEAEKQRMHDEQNFPSHDQFTIFK